MPIIIASLHGSNTCAVGDFAVTAYEPVFEMCRKLVAAGVNPQTRLECYRGSTLAFVVNAIGKGAGLTVEDDHRGTPRFRKWRGPRLRRSP